METRLSSTLMMIILFTLPLDLMAQEYREASHACFRLEEERVIPMDEGAFKLRKEWSGKQIFISIPPIPLPCSLIINGFPLDIEPGRAGSSEYNITPFLKEGDNLLELVPEDSSASSVPLPCCSLLVRDVIHIRDLVIRDFPGRSDNEYVVRVHLFIKNYFRKASGKGRIHVDLINPEGQSLVQESSVLGTALSYGQETEMHFDLVLENPSFWIPGTPKIYELIVSLEYKGKQPAEVISSQFAFTSFWQNDTLLVADGDTMLLRYPSIAQSKSLLTLKEEEIKALVEETGINAIRRETPLPCHLEALFQRCGILVVSDSK